VESPKLRRDNLSPVAELPAYSKHPDSVVTARIQMVDNILNRYRTDPVLFSVSIFCFLEDFSITFLFQQTSINHIFIVSMHRVQVISIGSDIIDELVWEIALETHHHLHTSHWPPVELPKPIPPLVPAKRNASPKQKKNKKQKKRGKKEPQFVCFVTFFFFLPTESSNIEILSDFLQQNIIQSLARAAASLLLPLALLLI
jgi:hypothetical protein